MKEQLTKLANEIYEANKKKGFHDKAIEIGTLLMLVVSELGEAIEAHRKGKMANLEAYLNNREDKDVFDLPTLIKMAFEQNIKDTFEDEIADAIIRLFDLCGKLQIDIGKHVFYKLDYNTTRPLKHGKKY